MRHWQALQVRPKYERVVATALIAKGIETFLPVYKMQRKWKDRVREAEQPLFPSYLFSRFDPTRRLPILITPGVLSIVSYGSRPANIDEQEIDAIQTIARSRIRMEPWPYPQVGDRVTIEKGPLAGLSGVLVCIKSSCRLVVTVTLIQRSVAAEIDVDMIGRPVMHAMEPRPYRQTVSVEPIVAQ